MYHRENVHHENDQDHFITQPYEQKTALLLTLYLSLDTISTFALQSAVLQANQFHEYI